MELNSISSGQFIEECAPYENMVYKHCMLMLKNHAEAEDAAQETMLKAFRSYDQYRGDGIARWLYRIAHNVCLDILKSARYRKEFFMQEDAPEEAASDPTPDAVYESNAEREHLWDCVAQLPLEQQTVLALYYGQGYDYAAIAEITKVSQGTVKSRLSRAKTALKAILAFETNAAQG